MEDISRQKQEDRKSAFQPLKQIQNFYIDFKTQSPMRLRQRQRFDMASRKRQQLRKIHVPPAEIERIVYEAIQALQAGAPPEIVTQTLQEVTQLTLCDEEGTDTIQKIIEMGLHRNLVDLCNKSNDSAELEEAIQILGNLSDGSMYVLSQLKQDGVMQILLEEVDDPISQHAFGTACMGLGNFCSESWENRDELLYNQALHKIKRYLDETEILNLDTRQYIGNLACWIVMADYPNHETVVSIDTAKEILKILDKIYCEEIQKELMWTLLYLLKLVENIDEEYIIGHEHYLDEIKYMIDNPPEDEYSLLPILRILKELLISHEENAEILYHMDILKSVLHLELSKPDVVKAQFQVLEAMTTQRQTSEWLFQQVQLLVVIQRALSVHSQSRYALYFMLQSLVADLPDFLPLRYIDYILRLPANTTDSNTLRLVLYFFKTTLSHDKWNREEILTYLEQCGATDYIEKLQYHDNSVIGNEASQLIVRYMDGEEQETY